MPVQKVKLEEAAASWLMSRRAEGLSASILRQNERTLRRLQDVIGNIWVRDLTSHHINLFMLDMVEGSPENGRRKRAQQSINNDRAALRKFCAWAQNERLMTSFNNPMFNHKRVKVAARDRLRIPATDFKALLDATECERDRAMIAIGLGLMLRQSELKLIRVGHVNWQEGYVLVDPHKGKTDHDRMPINNWLKPHLVRWMELYEVMMKQPLQPAWYLVPSRWNHYAYNDRVTGLAVKGRFGDLRVDAPVYKPEKIVQKAMEKIGYPYRDPITGDSRYEGEHTLRRSGARAAYDKMVKDGIPNAIGKIQEMLHHASVAHTRSYIGLTSFREERDLWLSQTDLYDTPELDSELDQARRRKALFSA